MQNSKNRYEMDSLELALRHIAQLFNLDAERLIAFADEDTVGGYDTTWPTGSVWVVEGKVLYALVRYARPNYLLELGTYHGCSATHIASAIAKNGHGLLTCVDNEALGAKIGDLIPLNLHEWIEFINADMREFVKETQMTYDFIFEDGSHNYEDVRDTWTYLRGLLRPRGFLCAHDTMHFGVGEAIQRGLLEAGMVDMHHWLIAPSDCGIGVWHE